MTSFKLPKGFLDKAFSLEQARQKGITFYQLRRMIQSGTLERAGRGVYQRTRTDFSEDYAFEAASVRIGSPNAVCLLSALAHYKLTDAIPKKTWLMVEASKRTKHRDLRLLRTRNPMWNIGIQKKRRYWITSLERTLVDAIVYRQLIGTNLCVEALRRAVKNNGANLGKLIDMGKKLGVAHRIRPYIEALA
jgi:predicted transcriptional regulator of viral defense system